ncbi:PaaI family thioesterase [Brevibacterium sp. FME37]|uniref:PaaI family thioesterase n=1 Tax=Brevibacterium sp. FME37 TaxID=2742607 RepID=UPI001868CC83|nr:PaaI family thioesterase [Brevibacterium sp. FME37]
MNAPSGTVPDVSLETASRFVATSGLIIDEVTNTSVHGHADLGADHLTPWGVVHGGVYTTMVESAGSIGASHAVSERGEFAVGVHNATDFLRPTTGARVAVAGSALHQGRSQQLWEVIITDTSSDKVLARGQLRLQNVPLPKEAN